MDVTIYIDTYHTGHLKKGIGSYSIVLEHINSKGEPKTKEYIGGLKGTTRNRTELKACISALSHMVKTSNIKIVTNGRYLVNSYNQNWDKTKNADLWQQLLQLISQHKVTFEYEFANPYSMYMNSQMRKVKFDMEEDNMNF